MNGPTNEELHSPDETPVLGAIMLFTIFALQLVSACSHRMLDSQFEPDSKRQAHCRILSVMSPFITLHITREKRHYSVLLSSLLRSVQFDRVEPIT